MRKTFSSPIFIAFILALAFISPRIIQAAVRYYYAAGTEQLNDEVKALNQKIYNQKDQINKQKRQQELYTIELRKKQAEKATLANQIALLDNKIKKIELDIEDLEIDISLSNLEIQKIKNEIEQKSQAIAKGEKNLSASLNSLYKKQESNFLEVFLLNDNLSDFLSQVKYLEDINKGIDQTLKELTANKADLEAKGYELDEENAKLNKLQSDLKNSLASMEADQESKKLLLEQTKESESEYQRLIQITRQEQNKAEQDISRLDQEVRKKLSQIEQNKLAFNDNGFIWPVPKNTITAYFHDPDYPYRYIFEHPAVDIRAGQSTPIKAPASGYVAAARDAGMGYSYIMLIHGDGISTVFGHVSKIYVKADEYVTQGQTIGLSGGMPGTPGAGNLTTGPHLHFETRLNGIPVDPMGYLP